MGVKVRRKNGKWYVVIDYHGRRKSKCVGTREAAEKVKREIEARLALGDMACLKPETNQNFQPSKNTPTRGRSNTQKSSVSIRPFTAISCCSNAIWYQSLALSNSITFPASTLSNLPRVWRARASHATPSAELSLFSREFLMRRLTTGS